MDMNVGRSIISAIAFIVAVVVSFILFDPIVNASDKVYLLFEKHCDLNGNPFKRVYVADEGGDPSGNAGTLTLGADGAACGNVAWGTAPTGSPVYVDEHGESLGISYTAATTDPVVAASWALPSGAKVREVLAINKNYETLAQTHPRHLPGAACHQLPRSLGRQPIRLLGRQGCGRHRYGGGQVHRGPVARGGGARHYTDILRGGKRRIRNRDFWAECRCSAHSEA